MDVRVVDDPRDYLALTAPLLLADEARHNLILGLAGTLAAHPELYASFRLWVVEDAAAVVATALRTPPHRLVLATPRDDDALSALVAGIDEELPGVIGTTPEVDDFAAAWMQRAGTGLLKRRAQGVFALEHVVPVAGVPGRSRPATPRDRALLTDWWSAFDAEALGRSRSPEQIERAVDHGLGTRDAGVALWEDDGRPVSLAGFGGPTPNGIRIGPVYTPPEHRARGYASALVAALSGELLSRGRRYCFLYTDLANPVANRIYERIGYARVGESAEIDFG